MSYKRRGKVENIECHRFSIRMSFILLGTDPHRQSQNPELALRLETDAEINSPREGVLEKSWKRLDMGKDA